MMLLRLFLFITVYITFRNDCITSFGVFVSSTNGLTR